MTKTVSRRLGVVLAFAALAAALPMVATAAASDGVTFARDVAPILQQSCQVCHQPDSIAPMSLLTYEETRPWARSIKQKVLAREMPPWHIAKNAGIKQFQNDRSLTDQQLETIVAWVDAGAPLGDPNDLPPPVDWPDPNVWQLAERFGEPGLIVRSDPFTMPANGQDKWWRPVVDTGLTEPRWVRAIEVKPSFPGGRKIVHHILANLIQDEEGLTGLATSLAASRDGDEPEAGLFMEWAIGKVGEIFPDNAGKLMLPGSKIRWEVHYHAVGEEVSDDVVEMAVYFYPKGQEPRYRTILTSFSGRSGEIDIRPGQLSTTEGFTVLEAPARFENFQPHMHMRGTAMSIEAIYPDGRQELLSLVDNFQWNWHINYVYAEDIAPILPKGTVVKVTAWHDNTAANRNNPDPSQWVGYGDRTVDEMGFAWVDVTYLEQDDYERLVADRALRTNEEE
jgi:hypothetical protein